MSVRVREDLARDGRDATAGSLGCVAGSEHSRSSAPDTWFAIAAGAVFILVAGFSTFHHEMWRDEFGAWLVTRDSPSPVALLWNMRYDGHPPLWYLLLWPVARVTRNPAAMQWVNLLVAGGAVFVIAACAPAPRPVRLLASFGYFVVYEYGTIARMYALGVLALVAYCALYPRRHETPIRVGLLLAGAALTSFVALLAALAALIAQLVETIIQRPAPPRRLRTWMGLAVALAGIALAVFAVTPPPDGGYAHGWFFGFDLEGVRWVFSRVAAAYVPLPTPGRGYWGSELLRSWWAYGAYAWIGGALIFVFALVAFAGTPFALVYYLAGTASLLVFFYTKFPGFLRHHGFLYVCLGTALWLAAAQRRVDLPARLEGVSRWAHRALAAGFVLILVIHVAGAAISVIGEHRLAFSGAKATAALIRERGLEHLPLVGDADDAAVAVLGYLEKDQAYYPAGGRFGSSIVWDLARLGPYDTWRQAEAVVALSASPAVIVLNAPELGRKPPPPRLARRLRTIGCRRGDVVADESYCVFVLDPVLHTASR